LKFKFLMDSSCQKIQPILQSLESPIFWPFSTKKHDRDRCSFCQVANWNLTLFWGQQALKIKSCLGIIFFSKKSLRNILYWGSVIWINYKLFATSFHEKWIPNFREFSDQLKRILFVYLSLFFVKTKLFDLNFLKFPNN
jgi:hypothetical protein